MKTIGIIPARYASNRLPGKPLLDLNGKSLIQRVFEQVSKANFDELVVATDDQRIMDHVTSFGGKSIMTRADHPSGTDRIAEALQQLEKTGKEYDVVVNIQGDEPFIDPVHLQRLVQSLTGSSDAGIATLATPIHVPDRLQDVNCVKVVCAKNGRALYFSRHPIPYFRDRPSVDWVSGYPYLQHLGVYGFRSTVLHQVVRWQPTALELAESLEQLRWLDHGQAIHVEVVKETGFGIDTPEDLQRAIQFLQEKNLT